MTVLPNNSIALEDVDVYNIPQDLDIILEPKHKKMVLIGLKVIKNKGEEGENGEKGGIFKVEK